MKATIANRNLTATINDNGAELESLININGKELIWNGNPNFWNKRSPVLFPIVGTLKNNSYTCNNTNYQLPRHGFARDMEFKLIRSNSDSCTFSLKDSAKTLKHYPFRFKLQIKYTLNGNRLKIEYTVLNKNDAAMPFSIGAHPAFALAAPFENYTIEMESDDDLAFNLLEDGLLTDNTQIINLKNKKLPLSYSLFENDALVFKQLKSNSLTILENEKPFIMVHFDDFPHLGIWTKPLAPFLCIEPWQGYSDTNESGGDLFKKEGIITLKANEKFTAGFTIEVF